MKAVQSRQLLGERILGVITTTDTFPKQILMVIMKVKGWQMISFRTSA